MYQGKRKYPELELRKQARRQDRHQMRARLLPCPIHTEAGKVQPLCPNFSSQKSDIRDLLILSLCYSQW